MSKFAVVDGEGRLLGFYSEDVHGPRQVEVTVPPEKEGDEPTRTLQANPACSIPAGAIEISDALWADWLGRQGTVALVRGELVEVGPKPHTWSWSEIRGRRDGLLRACDWTQLPDAPLPAQKRAAWTAYRQALRDLPKAFKEPAAVVWPTEPTL